MPTRLLITLFAAAFLSASTQAETRFFVSTSGSLLEGELVTVVGENVTLRRKDDGQSLNVGRSTLCREDQAYIDAWVAGHPEVAAAATNPATMVKAAATGGTRKFSLTSTIRGAKSNRGDAYVRTVVLSYTAVLQSREVTRDLSGAKGILITIAKDAEDTNRLYVMQRIEFDINLKAQSKIEYSTPKVSLSYDQFSGNRSGVKEQGCVLIVLDAAGTVEYVDASTSGSESYVKELLSLKPPCVVDRTFRVAEGVTLPVQISLTP